MLRYRLGAACSAIDLFAFDASTRIELALRLDLQEDERNQCPAFHRASFVQGTIRSVRYLISCQ
jgi:hypothetical protein